MHRALRHTSFLDEINKIALAFLCVLAVAVTIAVFAILAVAVVVAVLAFVHVEVIQQNAHVGQFLLSVQRIDYHLTSPL